jgi:xylulokinase
LDVGTTGVKALALSPRGEVLAVASRGYPLSTPRPGWSEQDPEDWWGAAESALSEVSRGRDVAGIGLSGQMHGLVVLDDADRVIRPAILWNDQRTAAECDEIEERVGAERLIALTGNRALTGFTAPKLLWLRRHEPEAYARISRVMLPKDYVRFRLTGEWAIDASDASGTLLLDVARRDWSADVLDALELPRRWLPPVLESPEQAGAIHASHKLLQGTPVAAGAGDQPAAAVGVGVDAPGRLSVVLGTSGVVLAALPAYAHDPEARVHTFCHAVPGTWQAMGVMLSAAGSLEWFQAAFASDVPFERLVDEAEAWRPGADGLLFLPYLSGERTPHADPDARGAFVGLELRHDRGALVRAVLEGVAFGLRDSLDLIRALGVETRVGRASGGGARSRLWLRIVASALGVPLELTESEEGSAFGAALLGGVAAGVFADVGDAVERCVRVSDGVEPDPGLQEAYAELQPRYRALYPALRPFRTVPDAATGAGSDVPPAPPPHIQSIPDRT